MITFPFTDVINAIRNAKKGVEVRENLAKMGEYCKQFTDEAGQKANAARDEAKGYAANAKASEKKATDAVAGIEQTKTDAVQAVQNAQATATNAVQQAQSTATTAVTTKQTEAVQAVGTAQTGAVKAVNDERDAALQQVADSTATAKGYAESAASAANAAGNAATAAGGYASSAESSATAASGSASAAATSESNANQSAENSEASAVRSEAAAKKAEAVVGTDKTLKTENAPADAKTVGDYILDAEGNVIFYSKAAVDELLKKKLGLHDTADNSTKWGDYERRFNETTGSTLVLVETDGKYVDLRPADSIGLTAIVASGSNYVRFGDGTQICWGRTIASNQITSTDRYIAFPVAFAEPTFVLTCPNANMGGAIVIVGWETGVGFTIGCSQNVGGTGQTSWIAIGRWK